MVLSQQRQLQPAAFPVLTVPVPALLSFGVAGAEELARELFWPLALTLCLLVCGNDAFALAMSAEGVSSIS